MFGKRPDGTRIKNLSRVRAFLPLVSPRRNESLVYYATKIDVSAAFDFLERINADRPSERRITLFHLYLRALARVFHERPGVNRFVAGGRLWQRNHVAVSFSAKQEIIDGAPMLTVKRIFPRDEGLVEMVDSILDRLVKRRGGERTSSDREVDLALKLPVFVVRIVMWFMHKANMWGLLPASMIDDDPLFTSVFVANLGSVGLEAGYHHLWEYGTCSIFAVLGQVEEREDGSRWVEVKYSYDERIEDGLYGANSMLEIQKSLEDPDSLL